MDTSNLLKIIKSDVFLRGADGYNIANHEEDKGWIMDFRRIILQPEPLREWLDYFWSQVADLDEFQVCGLEVAAIPLIGAVVADAKYKNRKVNGLFIRKSRKKTGLMQMIEGKILPNVPVVIVDDIINGGISVDRQLLVLDEAKLSVAKIITILRFRDLENYQRFTERGIEIKSCFTLNDLSDLGLKNLVTKEEEIEVNPFKGLWYFKNPGANLAYVVPKSGPTYHNGKVFFGTDSGEFLALDGATGAVIWKYKVPFGSKGKLIFSTPACDDRNVYFGAYDGNLYALNQETGKREWIYFDADWIGSSPAIAKDKHLIYIGLEYGLWYKQGGVAAIDTRTSKEVWKNICPSFTHASPGYSQKMNLVVCGCNDGVVRAWRAHDGKLLWEVQTEDKVRYGIAFNEEARQIIFAAEDGYVYFVDYRGHVQHKFKMIYGSYSTPLVFDNVAYVTSMDKNLYAIDTKTGQEIWKYKTYARIFSTPALIKGNIVFGNNSGKLHLLEPKTGKLVGSYMFSERITNKVAYDEVNDRLYVPTFANEMYCLIEKEADDK